MKRIGSIIMLNIFLFLAAASLGLAKNNEAEIRAQALRLYQEGLFQEMGTGNLEMAFEIYTEIAEKYADFADIGAVANFHLGVLCAKAGEVKKAGEYFRNVLEKYPEQKNIIARIQPKMKELSKSRENIKSAKVTKSKKNIASGRAAVGSVAQPDVLGKGSKAPKRRIGRHGLGLHNFGLHYRCAFGAIDQNMLEINIDYPAGNMVLEGRLYTWFEPERKGIGLFYNAGIAFGYQFDDYSQGRYLFGGLAGVEYRFARIWGIGLDVGYYYYERDAKDILTTINARLNLTCYF